MQDQQSTPRGLCERCGYALAGLAAGDPEFVTCPECGLVQRIRTATQPESRIPPLARRFMVYPGVLFVVSLWGAYFRAVHDVARDVVSVLIVLAALGAAAVSIVSLGVAFRAGAESRWWYLLASLLTAMMTVVAGGVVLFV